ncbi:hypothetical protein FN846DRAFT_916399 [Sphaerosporella brunnea]|uniref:Uncharacterized protein n=1 Tax=Sphaerosporella brunnea TaxID=1250544 RepID=A0A5J5F7M3_9PEZI|nr:hypothetical protein FN846DRAFT_916399 [Sphaerosporella brunnea]
MLPSQQGDKCAQPPGLNLTIQSRSFSRRMDPLSVPTSIAGLLHAAGKIATLISSMIDAPKAFNDVLSEAVTFSYILHQLQDLLIAILTGCVSDFSELQYTGKIIREFAISS